MYLRESTSNEKPTTQCGKKKLKNFKKMLDKHSKVCYNINVARARGAHLNQPTQKIILI